MAWLRQLLDWQKEAADPGEFLDSLRFDLHSTEVFVFTPKGDVIPLVSGATAVDFAYAVHTEVGHRCIGARVNGRLVALESVLDNGDVVEIFTSKAEGAGPSRDWLGFVKSPRARNKIRAWFAKERREDAVEAGKEAISRAMRKQGLPLQRLLGGEALPTIAKDLRLADVTALYAEVGEGRLSAQSVVQKVMAAMGGTEGAVEDIAETAVPTRPARARSQPGDPGVVVKGETDIWVKLARCCTPVPGDDDRRLRHPRPRRLGAPRATASTPARCSPGRRAGRRGGVGADRRLDVPRGDPGRGARPHPAAVRRDPDAVRRARQHRVGDRHHHPRPGRGLALHLRDGRPQAPGAPAQPGARRSRASTTPTASPADAAGAREARRAVRPARWSASRW